MSKDSDPEGGEDDDDDDDDDEGHDVNEVKDGASPDEGASEEGAAGKVLVESNPVKVEAKGWVDLPPVPDRDHGASLRSSPYGNSARMSENLQRLCRLERLKLEMEKTRKALLERRRHIAGNRFYLHIIIVNSQQSE